MKQVLVTGGTRGIGAGVAQCLAEAGYQVVAVSASQAELDAFVPKEGIELRVMDVTDQASVGAVFGSLDHLAGLVNCAGILRRESEYDIDVFQQVIEVNLTGTMRCCLAAHSLLADAGGSIVNTASMLSSRWADDGIRVNAIAPGWIETEMTEGLRESPERAEGIMARTPMKRWGKTSEVGALVRWLLSDEASFVTGSIYPVDGGYLAM